MSLRVDLPELAGARSGLHQVIDEACELVISSLAVTHTGMPTHPLLDLLDTIELTVEVVTSEWPHFVMLLHSFVEYVILTFV